MKKISKLIIAIMLVLLSFLPFLNEKVKADTVNENRKEITQIENGIRVSDSGHVLFDINYMDYVIYKSEKDGKYLYSLWLENYSAEYISINGYKVYSISFHDKVDELPKNIYESEIYIKVIFSNSEDRFFYATQKCENFNRTNFNNALLVTDEQAFLFENAFLDYKYDLRVINVPAPRNVEKNMLKQTLNSDFDLNNYYAHMNAKSGDDNPIINIIPKAYFTMACEYGEMGESYGYYIKTEAVDNNDGGYHFVSSVSVFNLSYISYFAGSNIRKKYIRRSINETFNYTYVTYLKSTALWNEFNFNPKKDCIVSYNSNIKNYNKIEAFAADIQSYGDTPITHFEQEVQPKYKTVVNGVVHEALVLDAMSFGRAVVNEALGLNDWTGAINSIYSFVKEIWHNHTSTTVNEDFNNLPESQYADRDNVNFFINDLSKSWDDSLYRSFNCWSVNYEDIYALYGDKDLQITFSDTYAIDYNSNDLSSYSTMETIVTINGYDIKSEPRKEYMNEIFDSTTETNSQLRKNISLSPNNNRTGFKYKTSTEDVYFINTYLTTYSGGDFKFRVFRKLSEAEETSDNAVICEATYFCDYTYNNISTMMRLYSSFDGYNTEYYFCIEIENCNRSVSFDFICRNDVDYNISNNETQLFSFYNNNETWITYKYTSNAVIGAYFIAFSSLSQTGNVDTIIEIYDSHMRRVAFDNDGYYDEEVDDPALGSLTNEIPIYINNTYYIKVRYRGSYNMEQIKLKPYVKSQWYSYGA